jgi:hypothetical protein
MDIGGTGKCARSQSANLRLNRRYASVMKKISLPHWDVEVEGLD